MRIQKMTKQIEKDPSFVIQIQSEGEKNKRGHNE